MLVKFLISFENMFIALKRNTTTGETIIGGHGSFFDTYKFILKEYFGVLDGKITWTQKNKVRFTTETTQEVFSKGVEAMSEVGMSLKQVEKHGRLMR